MRGGAGAVVTGAIAALVAVVLAPGLVWGSTAGGIETPAAPVSAEPVLADAPVGTGFTRTGEADPAVVVELALGLVRDREGMRRLALELSDPTSAGYGHHLGTGELAGVAGTESVGPEVVDELAVSGVDAWVDPSGLFVHARPTVAQATAVFGAPWGTYDGPGEAGQSSYVAADVAPTLPGGLVGLVSELTGFTQAVYTGGSGGAAVAAALPPAPVNEGTPEGCADAVATGAYTIGQLVSAYGIDQASAPAAHVVELIDGDGFEPSTYAAYAACFGIAVPAPTIQLVGPLDVPVTQSVGELDGDLQTIVGVAPTIGRLDALQGIHGPYQWPLLFAAGIDPGRVGSPAHAATFSDGVAETQLPSATIRLTEDIFVAYALVGTTVSVAAGDNGSQSFPGVPGLPQSYPASSPWVVAIGGTNTSLDRANQITEELVWNDTRYQGSDPEATGGGPSEVFEAPPWNPGSSRRLPDVSFFAAAYPGTAQAVDFGVGLQWYGAAGTSFATPLFATAVALVDARLEAAGRPRLGLVTPWLYRSASALWSSGALRDITVGSNDLADVGCCTASVGYDMASGLGSIRFDRLLDAAFEIGAVPAEPVALVPAFTG